jgi:hypothetical protein
MLLMLFCKHFDQYNNPDLHDPIHGSNKVDNHGENPILILVRHHLYMDVELLEYINQLEQKWFVLVYLMVHTRGRSIPS